MKYQCGHEGCDICGARECANTKLTKFQTYHICDWCLVKAIKLAIHVSETFSTLIDPGKPCGQRTEVKP
jgi:hypothetical protein